MHENLKHTVKRHLVKKIKKYSHFQTITTNNSKHFSRFHFKQYWHFYWVTPKQNYTLFQTSSNTDIFRELLVNNTTRFSIVYIKQYWHFQRVSSKLTIVKNFFRVYISHNNHTFRAVLSNNVGLFRTHIKQYSHFHRVIIKQ